MREKGSRFLVVKKSHHHFGDCTNKEALHHLLFIAQIAKR